MAWDYEVDDHGQPSSPHINRMRVEDRTVSELIGICKGMVAKGYCASQDVVFLKKWFSGNARWAAAWPMDVIGFHLWKTPDISEYSERICADLFGMLRSVIGGTDVSDDVHSYSSTLPFTVPQPKVRVKGCSFCFTGRFSCGARNVCEELTISAGGRVCSISKGLDYLVVGEYGSRDWAHSAFGRKIECAVMCNRVGACIAIISEKLWKMAIDGADSEVELNTIDGIACNEYGLSNDTHTAIVLIEKIAEKHGICVYEKNTGYSIEVRIRENSDMWIFRILDEGYTEVRHMQARIETRHIIRYEVEIEEALLFTADIPF